VVLYFIVIITAFLSRSSDPSTDNKGTQQGLLASDLALS
jgi:hypothetical protein